MNLSKNFTDFLSVLGFTLGIVVATLAASGFMRFALLLVTVHAIHWSFERNVEYGIKLASKIMEEDK